MTPEKKQSGEVCRSCGRMFNGQNPNVVSLKFLAELIGKCIRVNVCGRDIIGILRRFDNYSMVVTPMGEHDEYGVAATFPDLIVFKGPGVVVGPAPEPVLPKGGLRL